MKWLSVHFSKVVVVLVVGVVLGACESEDTEPIELPTRVNQADIAATFGLPLEEDIAATQTARAPTVTETATATLTPSPLLPTFTPSNTPTPTDTATVTPNPIDATITRIAQLTVIAETATAPTVTNTPTDTLTPTVTPTPTSTITDTPTITLTPSNTFEPRPDLPDNPEPNAVIFSSNRGGVNDIWVMTLIGEPSRPLVTSSGNDIVAACDPRGEVLVFDSDRGEDETRELYASDYDGSGLRQLTDTSGDNFQPVWSPDGERLAYVSTEAGDANIWLVNRAGTNFRPITRDAGDDLFPSWSPDGNVLFFSTERNGNFDIYQYNVETEEISQVTNTPDIDELYPMLSPNFQNIAYVAETEATADEPATSAAFVLDSNGFIRRVATLEGRIQTPHWVDDRRLLLSGDVGSGNVQVVLADVLSSETPRVLSRLGTENTWPRYCFIEPGFLVDLPETRPTPLLRPTEPTATPVTPSPTPTLTFTPSPTAVSFAAVPEAPENWLISRETWTGDEFAFIAPDFLPSDTEGFQVGNLLNLTWQDTDGRAVVTIALEPFRGELASTLIGYTVDDLPAFPPVTLNGIETAVNRALLRNSVQSTQYTLTDVTFTDVNITLTFRVPPVPPAPAPGAFEALSGGAPQGWLISTERWTANELATLVEVGGLAATVEAVFVGDQVQYRWTDADGDANVLLVRYLTVDDDLVVDPISYTVNEAIGVPDDEVLYILRESLLTNSINPGEFILSRIEPDVGAFELVFLVPPRLPE